MSSLSRAMVGLTDDTIRWLQGISFKLDSSYNIQKSPESLAEEAANKIYNLQDASPETFQRIDNFHLYEALRDAEEDIIDVGMMSPEAYLNMTPSINKFYSPEELAEKRSVLSKLQSQGTSWSDMPELAYQASDPYSLGGADSWAEIVSHDGRNRMAFLGDTQKGQDQLVKFIPADEYNTPLLRDLYKGTSVYKQGTEPMAQKDSGVLSSLIKLLSVGGVAPMLTSGEEEDKQ